MRGTTWLAALAVAAVACGRGGVAARPSAPNVAQGDTGSPQAGPSGSGAQGAVPCEGGVTLAVRGVDRGALTTFKMDLTGVAMTGAGAALTPDWSAAGTALSLTGSEPPELAALKRVAGPVDVTVSIGNVRACQGDACTDLDTCTAPITFQYDVDKADPNGCHVFLQLDLAGSVQPLAGGQAFLPRFSVKYW